ncbi:MAG TPA: tetratricopeptide repeat protein [Pyrinomonadaceae bacterium]|nr:tetratricopeptide repeat protein [Pyrinomonadaceae bacterium]
MSQDRIEAFKAMVAAQPEQEMVWYGLANEYSKLERWDEAADALRQVLKLNGEFTAAYQLLGTALINQGLREEARRAWTDGIEVANRTGAWKARQHMEGLLANSEAKAGDGKFCE